MWGVFNWKTEMQCTKKTNKKSCCSNQMSPWTQLIFEFQMCCRKSIVSARKTKRAKKILTKYILVDMKRVENKSCGHSFILNISEKQCFCEWRRNSWCLWGWCWISTSWLSKTTPACFIKKGVGGQLGRVWFISKASALTSSVYLILSLCH